MGVQGLWELLAPVGRRVSIETLAGKRLAIDASIWMIQFMKAMRDERGEMVRNAHLLGFFRRICKLLFLRTKPVFVFDGGTPALKWRTVSARRRQRENAQTKLRKTAEKLLLNQLKQARLKELAKELEEQRIKKHRKGKNVQVSEAGPAEKNDAPAECLNQDKIDEMLAASLAAEESHMHNTGASTSFRTPHGQDAGPSTSASANLMDDVEDEDDEDDEEMILPITNGNIDPTVLAALPPSMQLDLLAQMRERLMAENRQKYQKVKKAPQKFSELQVENYLKTVAFRREIDEVQKASSGKGVGGLQTARIASEGNKEFIFSSSFTGDKHVLASAGMKKTSENQDEAELEHSFTPTTTRESAVTPSTVSVPSGNKAPPPGNEIREHFGSDVQTYRDERRHMRVSRVRAMDFLMARDMSSADGAYIPLRSAYAFAGKKKTAENQDGAEREHTFTPTTTLESAVRPSTVSVPSGNEALPSSGNETRKDFGSDVQTYRDERGHMRVSRLRAMGIRMTRDLQRNLDLMKEMEQDMSSADVPVNVPINPAENDVANNNKTLENLSEVSGEKSLTTENYDKNRPVTNIETSWEISFEDDGQYLPVDDEDDFFAHLVAGDPIPISSVGDTVSKDHNIESDSDVEWEDGHIGKQIDPVKSAVKESQLEESNDDETELQWEDGISKILEDASLCPAVSIQTKSRGSNEEDAALQEAIERSLEDLKGEMDASNNSERENKAIHLVSGAPPNQSNESMQTKSRGSIEEEAALQEAIKRSLEDLKGEMDVSNNSEKENKVIHWVSEASPNQNNEIDVPKNRTIDSSISETGLLADMDKNKSPVIVCSSDVMPLPSADTCQNMDTEIDRPSGKSGPADAQCVVEPGISISGETAKIQSSAAGSTIEKSHNVLSDVPCESSYDILHSHITNVALADPLHLTIKKTSQSAEAVPPICHINEASDVVINLEKTKDPASDAGINRMASEEQLVHGVDEREHTLGPRETEDDNIEVAEARLEDELQILDEECAGLEDEQRKLERNAASVNSEMFVECQELLQMFGIPYIIAPMEAEAQCAYMELAGLVEGVVTDDSDVFLFGARSVYKNIFDDRKYVEAYLMKDIENELGLNREKLIRIAMLLGSDYTEGVSGIGIVNAIEVVNAFPEEDGLYKFREWIESPDPTILGISGMKRGSSSKKRGSKSSESSMNVSKDGKDAVSSDFDDNEKTKDKPELENIPKVTQIFMNKHRKVSKNWHIPSSFPSQDVISAYDSPQVDKSTEPCSWGKPDLFVLRRLCWEKFGWASQKADDVLLPVLKEYNKHETQLRLEAFYTFNERFAKIRSKRVKQAVKGITGNQSVESSNEPNVGGNKRKKRKKPTEESSQSPSKKAKSKTHMENSPSEKKQTSESLLEKETESRGGARATTRGRQRAQTGGRRKRKGTTDIEFSDTDTTDEEQDLQLEKVEAPDRVRRSTRPRKAAKYTESDDEDNQTTEPVCDATEEEKLRDQNLDEDNSLCFSEMGQCSVKDSVPNESVHGDYLFNGGGFCADEDEPEFGHYLKSGGGFWLDDSQTDPESQNLTREETERSTLKENDDDDGRMCSSTGNLSGSQPQHQQAQNVTTSDISEVKVGTNSPMKGLSAMPYLRRKRKKNS